jgi:hypothetical protein
MGFVRTRTLAAEATVGSTSEPGQSGRATGELVLVGCVKTKALEASPARDLYLSPLFERRRRYAELSGQPWYILSAEHGLLDPGTIISHTTCTSPIRLPTTARRGVSGSPRS